MQLKKAQFPSIEQMTEQYLQNGNKKASAAQEGIVGSFHDVLAGKVEDSSRLKFTKHANARLDSREITISEDQMQRLEDGARRAGEKGIKESLVLIDSLAFIVNTRQNTVITAMNQSETGEHVYTNIDGAVIM